MTTYGRCAFIDPVPGGFGSYDWPVNYSEESTFGRSRNVDHTATSDSIGVVRQQGEDDPLTIEVTGTIFHEAQHQAFIGFYKISKTHTVMFRDFTGDIFEVIITGYKPQRHRTLRNPRDPSIPLHYYTYTLTMDVVTPAGGWEG